MERKNISDWHLLAHDLQEIVYFNPEMMAESEETVFIVDSFLDAVQLEKGGSIAVSFAKDALEDGKIALCKGILGKFAAAFILIKDPEERKLVSGALDRHFPSMVQFVPDAKALGEISSVADLIYSGGNDALDRLLITAKQKPAYGLLNLADVKRKRRSEETMSGFKTLDMKIGGFAPGELSIWTGKRGSGKSTIANTMLLHGIQEGRKVCAYSGELPAWQFKEWAMLQAAGPENVIARADQRSAKTYFVVNERIEKAINAWWDNRFFLYDCDIADANSAKSIMAVLDLAAHRYGCSVFLVDNIMTARFSTNTNNFYREQSEFTGALVSFAKKNNVHVHLVAHLRKTDGKKDGAEADDVSGSGDITNRADNVFSMTRIDDEEAGFDAGLTILKNRYYGETGKIKLCFHAGSRRFYEYGGSPDERYSWGGG